MSEYQYYEFQTIDRPLNDREREAISQLSSRVELTASKAIFTYSYGDFRGEPQSILAEYFDAMYYVANWGTQQLMFRFPTSLINIKQIEPYCIEDSISILKRGSYVILDICFNIEDGFGWIEGGGELSEVIDLRNDILQQDYRLLYLAWLKAITLQDINEQKIEPPVPPGLNKLSRSLNAFVELFGVNEYLIKVGAKASSKQISISDETWLKAIAKLPREECDLILLELVKGKINLAIEFQQKISKQITSSQSEIKSARSILQLFKSAEQEEKETKQKQKQEAEAKKIEELKRFATQEARAWSEIERLLVVAQAKPYEEAVKLLVKLKDLAVYQKKQAEFQRRLNHIYDKYTRRVGLIRRLKNAGLHRQ
ncbi:hypothetical protein I4641_23440 [Waterburya agarophytonicola K14]|uniref:Uncharacterized protein n=1 Tax=Waterburya agarophytonicola KI4 TaxID=2874699 RepID=A0A964FLN1_9CYAN|nr:hypothetical protein [Waterburya agarophytonicola]MCC0179894.1 hypothetical protein [Waterburya agarophytonicola KI4]